MDNNVDALLKQAVHHGASDLHLKVGSAPIVRIDGALRRLEGYESLGPTETQAYAEAMFTEKAAADFAETGSADFAYGRQELGRFRATAFRQRGSVSLVLRRVVPGSRSFSELGLPQAMERIASSSSGLILVTGPSGSGKTTTMASIIDWINSNRGKAIITIEDPIEVLHPDKRSVVVQREVGVDTSDMATAVRAAMRHDTDVILISEIASLDVARAAIDAAETGHLVVSSMRTSDPADTVNRLISFFPDAQQAIVRGQLAAQLKAVISQILVDSGEAGQVLACEVLTNNERAQEWIMGREEPSLLVEVIKESSFHGMQTFDQALLSHVLGGSVKIDSILPFVRNTHEVKAKAMAAGISV
ncbi:MAG TPA: PilT/PilU family type 4a pilus ATPase [Acidimicrobiia bacterium]|nr:PilT/PilU family type 4a pilus ATPase [Acidimicrobiia bacterium]